MFLHGFVRRNDFTGRGKHVRGHNFLWGIRTIDLIHQDLAPLTTVGNLVCHDLIRILVFSDYLGQPFRRLCVDLGADITCGESEISQVILSCIELKFV
jgi:hypothetical protein